MAELSTRADETLAEAAARGDGAAFEILVRRHERVVRGFLARLAGSAALFPALIGIVIYWRSLLKRPGG